MADDRFLHFLRRLEGGAGFFDVEGEQALGPLWAAVRDLGLLQPTTPSRWIACPACPTGHVSRVDYLPDRVTGSVAPYLFCPDYGLVDVPEAALCRSLIDEPRFVAAVGQALGTFPGASTRIGTAAWQLGRLRSPLRSKTAYLVLRVRPKDQPELTALFATRPKAVLFLPTPAAEAAWPSDEPEARLPLSDFLTLTDGRLECDRPGLAAALRNDAPARPKVKSSGGGVRLKQINGLRKELQRHIRAARDYAFRRRQLTGEAALLTRPTQEQFGDRVGLSKYQTSNCFNHEEGRELKLLFDRAGDLDWIMSGGP
jgi:hypothetical protein